MSDLKRGDKIPGSKYYRDFCPVCGEPVRVSELAMPVPCSECDSHCKPGRFDNLTPRQREKIEWYDD